jgi:hypothetical protein
MTIGLRVLGTIVMNVGAAVNSGEAVVVTVTFGGDVVTFGAIGASVTLPGAVVLIVTFGTTGTLVDAGLEARVGAAVLFGAAVVVVVVVVIGEAVVGAGVLDTKLPLMKKIRRRSL